MADINSVTGTSSGFDIEPSTYAAANTNSTALGKDEFLNLLVKQLQYQDPLEPSSDTEFIAQMAQFSSLEQMQNLNDTFSKFQSYSMVGKYATANFGMETIEGYVESITSVGDTTYAVIDGTSVDVSEIFKVTDMAEELQVLTNILKQLVESNSAGKENTDLGVEGTTPKDPATEQTELLDEILHELQKLNDNKTQEVDNTTEENNEEIVEEENTVEETV